MRKLTTEEFVERARAVHGDKYDYSKSIYLTIKDKVEIICPIHGVFLQTPDAHMHHCGCIKCGIEEVHDLQRSTPQRFIQQAQEVHGDRYDYTKVLYSGAHDKVEIVCQEHESFWQDPQAHIKGQGCPKCGGTSLKNTDLFITEAQKVHSHKYDYSKVIYKKALEKVEIICPKHGSFWQTPGKHLYGDGCSTCGSEITGYKRRLSQEEYIIKAQQMHGCRYDYSKLSYTHTSNDVEIICPEHGVFLQNAGAHIYRGAGCPICLNSHGESLIRKYLDHHDLMYKQEYKFEDCKNKRKLLFDFVLFTKDSNIPYCCIEFDGKQHFTPIKWYGGDPAFKKTQQRDHIKNEYCKLHTLPLIRIPYYRESDIDQILEREIPK